jgi:hypothetical protein
VFYKALAYQQTPGRALSTLVFLIVSNSTIPHVILSTLLPCDVTCLYQNSSTHAEWTEVKHSDRTQASINTQSRGFFNLLLAVFGYGGFHTRINGAL